MRANVLPLVVLAALGPAACGGGGKNKAPATPSAPVPPSTPSTATATTFTPGVPGANLPPSTPLNSPTYRDPYIKSAIGAGVPTSLAPQIADCVIAKLASQGIKTVGQLVPQQAQLASDVSACTKQISGP